MKRKNYLRSMSRWKWETYSGKGKVTLYSAEERHAWEKAKAKKKRKRRLERKRKAHLNA